MTAEEQLLDDLRPAAFGIAYRMLGSVAEAEDVVQEALVTLHGALTDGERIQSPRAFVCTVTTRLAIDTLRSARVRRERYVGEWLPEPLLTDGSGDPALQVETTDSVSIAMLVLLESLTPEQRAALLLRDVFDYEYGEIAGIIGKTDDNARQLVSRARRQLEHGRTRFPSSPERRDELARRFFAAANDGDLAGLEALLADDVVLTGDGGGRVPALAAPLSGRNRVARALRNWLALGARIPGASISPAEVNGGPGALLVDGQDRLIAVWAFEIDGGRIQRVSSIINPDKLAHLGPVSDVRALLRQAVAR
jgi:RNA polymerase sigma-70 factor (ECF subfamily)